MSQYNGHGAAGPQLGINMGHQSAYASKNSNGRSFAFRKRYERIDWRRIASVDVDQVARTLDFNALQENIMNLTFCNIEAELDVRMVDPNFIKLFKLAQLTIEYLLHSQEYLTGVVSNMEEKIKKEEEDHAETKAQLEKVKKDLAETKKESHKRKKLLMAQQQLIHAGSGSYNKCPFCPKAFLNSSFLQSHINRRHNDFSGKAASVAMGAEQSTGQIPQVVRETKEIFQQFQVQQEHAQTFHEGTTPKSQDTTAKMEVIKVQEEDKKEIEKIKEMFMRELKDMNEKYQSSERAMIEMEQRLGKKSNLGDLQDDVDNERELLRQQKEEVAMLKEQLERQLRNASLESSTRTSEMDRRSRREERSRRKPPPRKQEVQIEKPVEDEIEEMLEDAGAAASQERVTPRGGQPSGVEVATKLMMEPSDDDEDTEMKSARGTGSFGRESMHSTMDSFRSGELTLRTTQFLEELRKNPTLRLMRDELISLLQDSLDKIGIPPETRGIPDDLLISKLALLKQRRQSTVQKYPIFTEFRKQCNAHADHLAREKLKQQKKSPPPPSGGRSGIPPRAMNTSMTASGTSSPVRSANQSPVRQPPAPVARQPAMSTPQRPTSASSGQGRYPPPQTQPSRAAAPQQQPKPAPRSPQRTPHSTGSSLEWTSTQWESGEDEETEEESEAPAFEHVRVVQSGPAGRGRGIPAPRGQPTPGTRQPVQVQSRGKAQDDDDDVWDSDISDLEEEILPSKSRTAPGPIRVQSSPVRNPGLSTSPARGGPVIVQPKGQKVAELSRTIEMQLAGRKEKKLAGAVDTMGGKKEHDVLDDFNSDSDWDVSPVEDEPRAATAPKRAPVQVRSSHASDTTNTYGTSVWGSSSKGASTVPAGGTQGGRASRGSYVSVTDVSSDEELDLDNI